MDDPVFVAASLPPPPARVLEVGCGRGELALALVEQGYDVVAIDPEAPDGPPFLRVTLEELDCLESFDAAVATRSLHHVADLAAAVDTLADRLPSGGPLVLVEFGWERLDEPTADWLHGQRSILAAAGRGRAPEATSGELLEAWREEHDELHTAEAMLAGLERRFELRSLVWTPYLYRELDGVASEGLERALVDAGAIQATGFRWVGERLF